MKTPQCQLCGAEVNSEQQRDEIEEDMEFDNKSCGHCGRTFREAREEEL